MRGIFWAWIVYNGLTHGSGVLLKLLFWAFLFFSTWFLQHVPRELSHNMQASIKPLLASHLLISHWPKQVTWPSPELRWGMRVTQEHECQEVWLIVRERSTKWRQEFVDSISAPSHWRSLLLAGADQPLKNHETFSPQKYTHDINGNFSMTGVIWCSSHMKHFCHH